ncbi:MAG: low specificity L-threonine aldolase, partial [Clostridium sp.]|nr:low specificity L-threonine aldolase [Clostridium sp.]
MIDSPTNQQFIILDNGEKDRLMKRVLFEEWEKMDEDHTAVRFAVSWSTKESDIDELFRIIDEEKKL